jgi:phosphatidate cytidylyltransferase
MILISIVSLCIYYGKLTTTLLVLVVGLLMNDELLVHFFKGKRNNLLYGAIQILYIIAFYTLIKFDYLQWSFCFTGIFLNLSLLWYLFRSSPRFNIFSFVEQYKLVLVPFFSLIPMISLVYIINFQSWQLVILLLLVVNFGMDSGAWFFGKSFGKHKLWPAVSPNKTIEGLLGGMLTSGLCGYGMYLLVFDKKNYWTIIIFSLLGLLSQIGDLVQSKLKRQYGIKDSSSLIPGHGGVYDRIDSLVFVLPFFVVTLYYYY